MKNILIDAWRLLARNRLSSAINILGLGMGMAACLLISLYVGNEVSYDRHWEEADDIYRVNFTFDNFNDGEVEKFAFLPVVALPLMKDFFPEDIAYGTRVLSRPWELTVGGERHEVTIARVDPDFLDIFQPTAVAGDLRATLAEPGNMAISEATAVRLFGRRDVIGEVMTLPAGPRLVDYRVAAVYSMPAANSILNVPAFSLLDVAALPQNLSTSWLLTGPMTFIKLGGETSFAAVSGRLKDLINIHADVREELQIAPDVATSEHVQYTLQLIRDIHLNSSWDTFNPSGNRLAVYVFAAIAVLVLIVACINFVVLSTARTSARVRGIAMRKTLGASRGQLFIQCMVETLMLSTVAMGVAMAVAELALPWFNAFAGMTLAIDYGDPDIFVVGLLLLLTVSLGGGIYPACLLSGFRPAAVLNAGHWAPGEGATSVRSALVVFQFSVSIALLVATAVIFAQVRLGLTRDIGFNKDNLLVMDIRSQVGQAQVLRDQLLRLPDVVDAGLSWGRPPQSAVGYYDVSYYLPDTGRSRLDIRTSDVGEGFFDTYRIPMVAGRAYDPGMDRMLRDDYREEGGDFLSRNLVINESAARYLGFSSPEAAVGETLFMPDLGVDDREMRFTIIGVSRDTQFYSLNLEPSPEAFHFAPDYTRFLTVRYVGSPAEVADRVQAVWESVMGDELFNAGFVDQYLAAELRQERLEGLVLAVLSLLAVLIACLGLYGLAAFTVDRRTREIGIRKVMGATVRQLVSLLVWQFSKPVLLANVFAWPVACWLMLDWLQRFPYQIAVWLLIPFCLAAGLVALIIAWLTVAGSTVRVATTNPVFALRYE